MTPEQVVRLKGWTYAMIGGGIASLYMAYQYAQPVVGIAEPPPAFAPYLFGGIGIACLIVAAVLARRTAKSGVAPAVTDLSGPKGKAVIWLMVVGLIALVGLTIVNIMAPDGDMRWLAVSVVLLIIMAVCFVTAGRIARNKRRNDAAAGAVKE